MKWKLTLILLLGAVSSEVLWRYYTRTKPRKQQREAASLETVKVEAKTHGMTSSELTAFEIRKPPDEWNTVLFFPDLTHERSDPESLTSVFFNLLDQAKLSLHISIMVASLREFENVIYRKHQAGLLIQVITDYDTMTAHNNVNCHHFKHRGIPVRTKNTGHLMHNKFIIVDEEAVATGSPNFTLQAFSRGHESIVITTDPRIVKQYINQFGLLWNQCGRGQ